jgi:hypothetical protein
MRNPYDQPEVILSEQSCDICSCEPAEEECKCKRLVCYGCSLQISKYDYRCDECGANRMVPMGCIENGKVTDIGLVQGQRLLESAAAYAVTVVLDLTLACEERMVAA